MNLAFFLTPLADVAWLSADMPVADAVVALQTMGYTAVPLLDDERHYVGTVTAADLLRFVVDETSQPDTALGEVARRSENRAVSIDTDIRSMLTIAAAQNFVPVVDSRNVLMGIVTRKAILTFFERMLSEHGLLPAG